MVGEDIPRCAAMVQGHTLFEAYGLVPQRLEKELWAGLSRGDGLLVAVACGHPAGFAWYLERGCFGRSAYLRLLVVESGRVGQGIGRRLMEEVEARAFARAEDLFLLVNVHNAGAQAFYQRLGYACVGKLLDYAGPGLHEYIYRKRRPAGPCSGENLHPPQANGGR